MKQITTVLCFLFIGISAFAQKGKVLESLEFKSKSLNSTMQYSVYLPEGYESSQRSYPVVYLLHGYSDDETGWIQFGEADVVAQRGVDNGDFPPSIIVMPDGGVSWYCNDYAKVNAWRSMFAEEFIPFIESNYRIRAKKEFRAIAGLSMGGFGALQLSMNYPELFSSCIALSSGTFTDDEIKGMPDSQYEMYFKSIFGKNLKGEERISETWKAHSPLHLIRTVPAEKLKSIRFYIDCGDDDFLYKGNSALHVEMRTLGLPHEYRVRQGGHVWEYWRTGLYDGLKFAGEKFRR